MYLDIAVILAALGITTLELVEAAAVALALYGETHRHAVFAYVALGIIAVFIPTFIVGKAITYLPIIVIRIVGGSLLLYFGLRLVRSARRSVLRARKGGQLGGGEESLEKGFFTTAFSVGAIEAFEASIVLVGLLPENYISTVIGIALGVAIVIISTYILRSQARKIKQANMKVIVSALLLSFSTFWFAEIAFPELSDLILIPLFIVYVLTVHWVANRPDVTATVKAATSQTGPK